MRVTNCTQNNMPKQSFGMKVLFHPDDVAQGRIPHHRIDKMIEVLIKTNADVEVAGLKPDEVRLQYQGIKDKIYDCWSLVSGAFKPKEIMFNFNDTVQRMSGRLSRKAQDLADEIAKQPINAQKNQRRRTCLVRKL